jgi:hypothetical protein
MIVHACNSSYSRGGDWENCLRSAQAKISKTLSQQISCVWRYVPVIPVVREAKVGK